ncbi:MAG: NAD(P)/FAD-dependent oxidoreductase [Acidimicrobiales bacterium]
MTGFARVASQHARRAVADAVGASVWLDNPCRPAPRAPLEARTESDLLVVGGGLLGLWTALLAKEHEPEREVVVVEGETIAWAASGRNGGVCSSSLTHGLANGLDRWPAEMALLSRLGHQNLDEIGRSLRCYEIDCGFERTGDLEVATEGYQLALMEELWAQSEGLEACEVLDAHQVRAHLNSPTYLGGLFSREASAILDPARLAWGLAEACSSRGVIVHEQSRAEGISRQGRSLEIRTAAGSVRARHVVLATNAFPALVRRARPYVVPVYDYVLATEPLAESQLEAIGWAGREAVSDSGNQFHYYRLTPDNRILFGGYDAIYYFGSGLGPALDQRPQTFELLAEHFFATFPQLNDVRFSHTWGGAIDTCTRFSPFWGKAWSGQLVYAAGFTGLGVGATRFAAAVLLDLLAGRDTERTRLEMVRRKPLPFPPEPLRSVGIQLTRWSLDRADRRRGRRNLWLRGLDSIGAGFDS